MKEFIEKSGLTAAQFAKKYEIPYNTVRQWAEGIRSAPSWLKKIFESENAYKPLIEKNKEKIYICYLICDGKEIHSRTTKDLYILKNWKENTKDKKIKAVIKECEVITETLIE